MMVRGPAMCCCWGRQGTAAGSSRPIWLPAACLSGWSDAAYKGSIYVLNMHFGAAINPKEESTIKCINGDIVDPN